MSRKPSVYLAGPDIFRKDAASFAQWQREICEKYGVRAIHPMDNNLNIDLNGDPRTERAKVYAADVGQMLEADVICANMNSFRGSEPDSGTCFEAGFFAGWNKALEIIGKALPQKPMYGYVDSPDSYHQKAEKWNAEHPTETAIGSDWCISPVDMHVNLMMEVPMEATGAFVNTGFEDCIKQIAEDFAASKFKVAA